MLTNFSDGTEFMHQGPLYHIVNHQDCREWRAAACEFASILNIDPEKPSIHEKARILEYYLPVFFWILQERSRSKCSLIGISAPQGSGKTTLTQSLIDACKKRGINAVAISIDDFYLTGEEQERLSRQHGSNPLLQNRGNSGTHDIGLLLDTLCSLKSATANESISIPKYIKSMRQGRGDREAPEKWPKVNGPVNLILLEGWMLGFIPLPEACEVISHNSSLRDINIFLNNYKPLHKMIDAWIIIKVEDLEWIRIWRKEAEHSMIVSGQTGMTDDEIDKFINSFMPAYHAYLPGLYSNGPDENFDKSKPLLTININFERLPV